MTVTATADGQASSHWEHPIKTLPLTIAGLVITVYVVVRTIFVLTQSSYDSTLVDECLVLILSPWAFAILLRPTRDVGAVLLSYLVFAIISFTGALFSGVTGIPQPLAAIHDLVLDAKILVAFLGFLGMLNRGQHADQAMKWLVRVLVALALINALFVVRDFALGGGFGIRGQRLLGRLGSFQPQGIFLHQVESAWVTLLGAICAAYMYNKSKKRFWGVSTLILAVALFLHLSAKESVALVAALSIIFFSRVVFSKNPIKQLAALFLISAVTFYATPLGQILANQADEYVGSSALEAARTVMTLKSVQIASDFFPLGSGGGTFASPASYQLGYSSIYTDYGLSSVWGASREMTNFLTDVFWPKILAQSGFLGVAAYTLFLWFMFRPTLISARRDLAFGKLTMAIWVSALIISVAAVPFSHELMFVVLSFTAAYARVSLNRPHRI